MQQKSTDDCVYVLTWKTPTGLAVYRCPVVADGNSLIVDFRVGTRIAGGGVPSQKRVYRFRPSTWNDYIFHSEGDALRAYLERVQYARNRPKRPGVLKLLPFFIEDARRKLALLTPAGEEPVEQDLVLTSDQLKSSIEQKEPSGVGE